MTSRYRKLVVGGGRISDYPTPKSGELALNIQREVKPHVVGDIFRAPFKSECFEHIVFERFAWTDLLDSRPNGIEVAHRLMKVGGKLVILTGVAPLGNLIPELETHGFLIETLEIGVEKCDYLVFCHNEWINPGGVYIRAVKVD